MDITNYSPATAHNSGLVTHGDDSGLIVRFYKEAKIDGVKTKEAGHPVFRDVDFVSIRAAGSKDEVVRQARAEDKQRFAPHWQAYQSGEHEALEGYPIEQWPALTPSQIKNLQHFGIRTVEQLAGVNDSALGNLGMGMRKLRDMGKAFIEQGQKDAPVNRLAEENEELRRRIEFLEQQSKAQGEPDSQEAAAGGPDLNELATKVARDCSKEVLDAATKPAKKRGRPAKAA